MLRKQIPSLINETCIQKDKADPFFLPINRFKKATGQYERRLLIKKKYTMVCDNIKLQLKKLNMQQ